MPNRHPGMITQDWEPVTIHKTKQKASELKDPKAVNAAMRAGAQVQSVKKFDAGSNKKGTNALPVNTRKLDEETEPAALERVKVERVKVERVRVKEERVPAALERVKVERVKVERVKVERVKVERVKVESVKVERVKVERVKVEGVKVEERAKCWVALSSQQKQAKAGPIGTQTRFRTQAPNAIVSPNAPENTERIISMQNINSQI
ncbi:multiprotein-bridging factor 1c-like [Amborella trichopoda]|uniref:multiprotein-bridging factor 1c-like n=1 Tax=Amborella trichopoda TaxID=13333 RepID=UPI0009BD06BD|nr:multiprotein-bridging factor 1c-like [Amborella trichopoda]|eukprot:XP_020521434.1 multiprotein-bridging factor 1c-like [Amborella trichopoda]